MIVQQADECHPFLLVVLEADVYKRQMYIGIAHGVGYVVRFCRTPDINLQAQADGKLIAYHGFLFTHAAVSYTHLSA